MQRIKFDESDILDSFFDKAMQDGLLDRKAEYQYAEFDFKRPAHNELMDIVAVASKDNQLYGLPGETGEQMVGKAHPGGGTQLDFDNNAPKDKDLAKVETVVERQKVMREVAEGKPTGKLASAVQKLVALANLMDERGEVVLAKEIDAEIAKIAAGGFEDPVAEMSVAPDMSMEPEMSVGQPAQDVVRQKAERAARIKANNTKVIHLLNDVRKASGKPPLAASPVAGILTKEVVDDLKSTVGEGYKTWGELFGRLQSAKPAELDVSRRGVEAPAPVSVNLQPLPAAPAAVTKPLPPSMPKAR